MSKQVDGAAFKECQLLNKKKINVETIILKNITTRCEQIVVDAPNTHFTGNITCNGCSFMTKLAGGDDVDTIQILGNAELCAPNVFHVDTITSCNGDPSPVTFITDVAIGQSNQNTVPVGNFLLLNPAARHTEMSVSFVTLQQPVLQPNVANTFQYFPPPNVEPTYLVDNEYCQLIRPNTWTVVRFGLPNASIAGPVVNWLDNPSTTGQGWPAPIMYWDRTMGFNGDFDLEVISSPEAFAPQPGTFLNGLLLNRPDQSTLMKTIAQIQARVYWRTNDTQSEWTQGIRAIRYKMWDATLTNLLPGFGIYGPTVTADASAYQLENGFINAEPGSVTQHLDTIEPFFGSGFRNGGPSNKMALQIEVYQTSNINLGICIPPPDNLLPTQPAYLNFNWYS